jgi:hypothetical protein
MIEGPSEREGHLFLPLPLKLAAENLKSLNGLDTEGHRLVTLSVYYPFSNAPRLLSPCFGEQKGLHLVAAPGMWPK